MIFKYVWIKETCDLPPKKKNEKKKEKYWPLVSPLERAGILNLHYSSTQSAPKHLDPTRHVAYSNQQK